MRSMQFLKVQKMHAARLERILLLLALYATKSLLSRHLLPDGLLSSRLRVSLLVRISAEFWFVLVEASIARLVAAIV